VLHQVDRAERVDRFQTTADSDGRYRFDALSTADGVRYLPAVEYGGAAYFQRPLSLAGQPHQTADIVVYEPIESDQWIVLERANLLLQQITPNRLDVLEMGAVANIGDRTFVGAEEPVGAARPVLRLSVPFGAVGLAPQAGFAPNDFRPTGDGFTTASPVVPGRHQLAYSYSLAYDGESIKLSKRLDYPTASFNLYVPDIGLQVASAQLQPPGQTELGGQRYLVYAAQNLPRGTVIRAHFNGLPHTGDALSHRLVWPILGGGGGALLSGLLVARRRQRMRRVSSVVQPDANGHEGAATAADLERYELLLALARLDQRHAQGEVPEERYLRERAAGKRRLVELARRKGAAPGDR
jgi:hypothetical protein